MRIVLDSSVLIATISRPGVCTELVEEVARYHTLILSEFILGEVYRKLRNKFGASHQDSNLLVQEIRSQAEVIEPAIVAPDACRDPTDLPILGSAIAGNVELLVTVDKDLLSLVEFQGIPIVRPGDYWKRGLNSGN